MERVAVKPDTLGDFENYQFGTRIQSAADAIVVNRVVAFDTINLGQANRGGIFTISVLRLTKNIDFSLSQSMSFTYTIKCNGTVLITKTGTLAASNSSWYLETCSGEISESGSLTLDITLTNVSATAASFRVHANGSITGVGLNKIGKDGAVFAKDNTHYNWFGADKTRFQQGSHILQISESGAFYDGEEINRLAVKTVGGSGGTVNLTTLDSFVLVLPDNSGATVLNLPSPDSCAGKVFYVKNMTDSSGRTTSIRCPSKSNCFVKNDAKSASDDIANIDIYPRMYVSAGGYWIELFCS